MIYHHYPSPKAVARAVAETAFMEPSQAGWVHIALSGALRPDYSLSCSPKSLYVAP